jgi:hypothetical protein
MRIDLLAAASRLLTPRGWPSLELMDDATALARAWLTEHPTDDDTPFDVDWLAEVGFLRNGPTGWPRRMEAGDANCSVQFWCVDEEWTICDAVGDTIAIRGPKTRGDVRRLCRCLGVPIGGPQ